MKMSLEKFGEDIQNNGYDLMITVEENEIIVEAFEPEFNHDFFEIMANIDFIEGLNYNQISETELRIMEA